MSNAEPRRRGAAAAALASLLVAACAPPAAEQSVEFRVPVTVEEVGVATLEDRIVTTGTLRAPELVTLSALDTGILEIEQGPSGYRDRKSTRLNSSHVKISYAVFCSK